MPVIPEQFLKACAVLKVYFTFFQNCTWNLLIFSSLLLGNVFSVFIVF